MDELDLHRLLVDLLVVLAAGFAAGAVCRRLGVSLLVGYLVVGGIIGNGGLDWVTQSNHELDLLAHAGALLLLFSVGLELSLEQLGRGWKEILCGGAAQMLIVGVPMGALAAACGLDWRASALIGAAGALSSTILVFKALTEWGESNSVPGRRAIGILLFQDIALVPLMLVVPLLTGTGETPLLDELGQLVIKSLLLILGIVVARWAVAKCAVPLLVELRSVELMVLFTVSVLVSICWITHLLSLPSAMGALAAGLVLNGNRISMQIDTLSLPFRETFAAIFFVTLGTLLKPAAFLEEPLLLLGGLLAVLAMKSLAATIALRFTGLSWIAAAGMGIGLAQMGEFSLLLLIEGVNQGVIEESTYNQLLFIAIGTLILTPQLIKLGLRWSLEPHEEDFTDTGVAVQTDKDMQHAVVIGMGPIGRQITSRLELMGVDVCLIDQSPINLHGYAQQGFHTVAGDARELEVLRRAEISNCRLAIVCVPDDDAARQIVASLRDLNSQLVIFVRCRYLANISPLRKSGADEVVSEEGESTSALLKLCQRAVVGEAGETK